MAISEYPTRLIEAIPPPAVNEEVMPAYPNTYETSADQHGNTKFSEAAVWLKRLAGNKKLGRAAVATLMLTGVFEHTADIAAKDANLISQIGLYDVAAAFNAHNPFYQPPQGEYSTIMSYRLPNDLFENQGWYASTWQSSRALNYMCLSALLHRRSERYTSNYSASLAANNNYYWSTSIAGHSGYLQGPAVFHVSSSYPLTDDSQWMGLNNACGSQLTGNGEQLKRAEEVQKLGTSQWDTKGGGEFWMVQEPSAVSHGRTAISNLTYSALSAELYIKTRNRNDLIDSERALKWTDSHLMGQRSGLINDHMSLDGKINYAKFSYNQGERILADALLSQAVPAHYSLKNDVEFAKHFIDDSGSAPYFKDLAFASITYEALCFLAGLYHHSGFTHIVRQCMAAQLARMPKHPESLSYASGRAIIELLSKTPTKEYSKLYY